MNFAFDASGALAAARTGVATVAIVATESAADQKTRCDSRDNCDSSAPTVAGSQVSQRVEGSSAAADYEERAAISEFDGGLKRDQAEALAALQSMPLPIGVNENQRSVIIDAAARFLDQRRRRIR